MSSIPLQDRYPRQTMFKPIGKQGQECQQGGLVGLTGCGAMSSTLSNNLCRACICLLGIAHCYFI